MRADRLVATLLVLQAKGRVTAAELADELEVSVKTARRDLEALAIAGIPVYSQAGKGGGWQLLGGARTDLSGLTAAEARTLFMVAGPSSTATPDAKAALRKLVQALPETFRADAEAAASAVVLDPAGWGGTAVPRPPHLDELQRAVVDGVQVRLGYADRTRSESRAHRPPARPRREGRRLVPRRRHRQRDAHVPGQPGALASSAPTTRSCGPPASTWRRPGTRSWPRSRRSAPRRAPSCGCRRGALHALRPSSARAPRSSPSCPTAASTSRSAPRPHEYLAEHLAGWGDRLEVIEPAALRGRLAAIGRQLVARYGEDPIGATGRAT